MDLAVLLVVELKGEPVDLVFLGKLFEAGERLLVAGSPVADGHIDGLRPIVQGERMTGSQE